MSSLVFVICRHFDDVHSAILTGVRWYLMVALICISLIVVLNVFTCASWSSVCLLWRNVCLGLLPIFWLGCLKKKTFKITHTHTQPRNKPLKMIQRNGMIPHALGLEELILLKWLYCPKQHTDLTQSLSNYPWHFSQD